MRVCEHPPCLLLVLPLALKTLQSGDKRVLLGIARAHITPLRWRTIHAHATHANRGGAHTHQHPHTTREHPLAALSDEIKKSLDEIVVVLRGVVLATALQPM